MNYILLSFKKLNEISISWDFSQSLAASCILHSAFYLLGGEYRDRTGDLLLARQALSQLS